MLGVILGAGLAAAVLSEAVSAREVQEHAVVVILCDGGHYELVSAIRAPGPVPKESRGLRGRPVRVAVVSKTGEVLFETGLRDPAVIRGEFAKPGGNGEIVGHYFTRERYTFAVRVPVFKDARVDLFVLDPKMQRAIEPPPTAFRKVASFSPVALEKVLP